MKKLILLSVVLLASNAALASNACRDHVECGTYEASETTEDGKAQKVTIKISDAGSGEAELVFTRVEDKNRSTWPLRLSFGENGSFVAKIGGRLFGTGICSERKVCTFSLFPMQTPEGINYGIAGVILFSGDTLTYNKLGAGPGHASKSTLVLKKQ